jgi:formyltetrahydrofolate deformylase
VSKQGHCLQDLLLRYAEGELPCSIALIVSNHETHRSTAEWFGIPFHHIPVKKENKEAAEARQIALLRDHEIDVVVLARYMQILGPQFIAAYPNRIINIHHSFLPAFVGARPYHQAFARGVKIIGATSHYVTEDLDEGPIIEQDVTRVSHRDSVQDLVRKGRNLEKLVLAHAVKLHLEHRILAFKNKTIVFE